MARRKKKTVDTTIEDLNLVPIMNLVVCLIPVVLVGMTLVKLGVINVNAPRFGMGQAEPSDDEEKPLGLTVAITADGFLLTATGADINAELGQGPANPSADPSAAPAAPGVRIEKNGEMYNYAELYNKMVILKDNHKDETIVNLTAEPTIHFKYIISVMDSIRFRLTDDSFANAEAFTGGSVKMDGVNPEWLWPDVVFAVPRQ